MIYSCLHRSRMAKRDVLRLLIQRQIKDGQWHCQLDLRNSCLEFIRALRDRLASGASITEVINDAAAAFHVRYNDKMACHVIESTSIR